MAADLKAMLRKFGVVTVMDVDFYKAERFTTTSEENKEGEWDSVTTFTGNKLFSLRSLKISNINTEGPTKTEIGGKNADKLLKYGKTFTIEMQDALGHYEVLKNIYGANTNTTGTIVAITDRFPSELTIVGTTFVVDQATGAKQPLKVIIPIFLGDGIFNLTQEAEGDVSVFDMNGDILRFEGGTAVLDETTTSFYATGADNQYYFFATEQAYEDLTKPVGTDPLLSYKGVWDKVETPVTPELPEGEGE